VQACSLKVSPSEDTISMATKTLSARMQGICKADIETDQGFYSEVTFHVFPNLCADMILGQD